MANLVRNGIYILVVSLLGACFSWYFLDAPLSPWLIVGALIVPLIAVIRKTRRADKLL
ncbi:hypothetical protein V0242_25430 (plasmid) [Aeromonas hydrophila]|uniref:hypothetical protein n=1 Tax=Aeromonas hydrophila TaxID=644 RepID=UPI002ED51607|nr:hypothetical protein V0242_25430 [Aeromonas hydrophila]